MADLLRPSSFKNLEQDLAAYLMSLAMDRATAVIPAVGEVSVAELAGRVLVHYPGTEQIVRGPSGGVVVYYSRDGQPGADIVNPLTGEGIAPYEPSVFLPGSGICIARFCWMTQAGGWPG